MPGHRAPRARCDESPEDMIQRYKMTRLIEIENSTSAGLSPFNWEERRSGKTGWIEKEIEAEIEDWIKSGEVEEDLWRKPIVGIASAQDALFEKLRDVADSQHALPSDLLPGASSVIAYFLPFQKRLGKENGSVGPLATRSWAEAYVMTNRLIHSVNERLARAVRDLGGEACVTPATHNFDVERLVSGWSHKHVAYIAGIGTFGHNRLLITASGCCGRLGSLVTTLELPSTPRLEVDWCLLKAGRSCLACARRCPCGALQADGFDRHACYRQLLLNDAHHSDLPLVDVCGKCACEMPCSHSIPAPLL